MAKFPFNMPDVGEGGAEAEIVAWHVKAGDRVEEDQHLVDVRTDKATIDIESPVTGVVTAVSGEAGDTISVGAMLLVIEIDGEVEDATESVVVPEPSPEMPVTKPVRAEPVEAPSSGSREAPIEESSEERRVGKECVRTCRS